MNLEPEQNSGAPWRITTNDNIAENYAPGPRIKVRCIDPRGLYYDFLRRRKGDVFTLIPMFVTVRDERTGKPVMEKGKIKRNIITAQEQFSPSTMQEVDPKTPETVTDSKDVLDQKTREGQTKGGR